MNDIKILTKTRTKQKVDVGTEVSKAGLVTIAAFAGLVALWSVVSLVSGMIAAGGPVALVQSWFSAIMG